MAVSRRTVTVLFADVADSTALGERLDPETVRGALSQWFEQTRAVIERHGGTVEKYVGDAVMALFGVPQVHEDDGLRAVRAADEIRAALDRVNENLRRQNRPTLQARIGVNTGEVVAGHLDAHHSLATGDAVNVASRLEELADPGEILLGDSTYRLVRDAVSAEPMELRTIKGRTAQVRTWRLLDVAGSDSVDVKVDTPFVGREHELETLRAALDRTITNRSCELVTIVGEPGVGKSRLVREFLGSASSDAEFLVGRCLPYGDGITYWPLAEIVKGLTAGGVALDEIVGDELAAARLAGSIGLGGRAGSSEETQWAARKLFEALARRRPLIVFLDDVHWAEPTFLDLVEYVLGFSESSSLLLVCVARPDLLDVRPSWTAPRANASLILVERLPEAEAETLVELLGPDLSKEERDRVLSAAEGNPLFVEHLLSFLAEGGGGNGIPPSLQALLAARIDALDSTQRATIECAAIEGRTFHRGAVMQLLDDGRSELAASLLTLLRKGLVRPGRSRYAGDDAFRFAHTLIREAAYAGILKGQRADLHTRFAEWLEAKDATPIPEYEEVLGYHLEQAFRYRVEIASHDDAADALGRRAAHYLEPAGERALARGDMNAAGNLLGRACEILGACGSPSPNALVSLAIARTALGELEPAREALTEAIALAEQLGERTARERALVELAFIQFLTGEIGPDEAQDRANWAIAVLESAQHDVGLARAFLLLVFLFNIRLEYSALASAAERASFHARRAGAERVAADALLWSRPAVILGPQTVHEEIERAAQIPAEAPGPLGEAAALFTLGCLHLMNGEAERGRECYGRSEALFRELGMRLIAAAQSTITGWVELVCGDAARAESLLRTNFAELEEMGERGLLSGTAAELGLVLCARGQYEEAEQFAATAEGLSGPGDAFNSIVIRSVRARVLAAHGMGEDAIHAAEEALSQARAGDSLELSADALRALAEANHAAGRIDEARGALQQALDLYRKKQNVAAVAAVEEHLERLIPVSR